MKPNNCLDKHQMLSRQALNSFFLYALIGLFCAACSSASSVYSDPASRPAHQTEQGFKNRYIGAIDKPFSDLLKWRWGAWSGDKPPAPQQATPQQSIQLAQLSTANQAPAQVTWLGHSTVLVQTAGLNILTDPIFSARASPVSFAGPQRQVAPAMSVAQLPPIDAVLISHNHYDHLDTASVLQLAARFPKLQFIVPLGLTAWFESQGIARAQVTELDWWQSVRLGPASAATEIFLTPVQHWSGRGLWDRNQTLWGGFAIFAPHFHWYFGGDSGYSPDFSDTRAHFASRQLDGLGFDLALLPIGAYEPRWFMQAAHMNPAEAVQAHKDLGAQRSVAIHWGTFNLTDEALDEPPIKLDQARTAAGIAANTFMTMAVGQTLQLPARASK